MIENTSEKGLVGDRVEGENTERERESSSFFVPPHLPHDN